MMVGGGGAAGCTLLVVIVDVLVAFIMAGPARVLESTTSALSHGLFLECIFTVQSHSHFQSRDCVGREHSTHVICFSKDTILFLDTYLLCLRVKCAHYDYCTQGNDNRIFVCCSIIVTHALHLI